MQPRVPASVVNDAQARALAAASEHEAAMTREVDRVLRRYVRSAARSFAGGSLALAAAAAENWTPPTYSVPVTSDLIDATALNGELEEATRKYRARVTETVAGEMASSLGISFTQRNRLVDGVIAHQSGMKITTAPEGLVGAMMRSLQESYDNGVGFNAAAAAMRRTGYTEAKGYAERIARTETIRASNAASLAAVKMGTDLGFKKWMAFIDNRTRTSHRNANGQTVPIDGVFQVGADSLEYPGDDAGSPEEVVNCRCTIGYAENPSVNVIAGGSMATVEAPPAEAPTGASWSGIIAQEGVDTGDGRRIEAGALNWRELPLPLMAQLTSAHGGLESGPAVLAGRIEDISRDGQDILGGGVFDTGDNGAETQRLVDEGFLKGISVDLAVNEAEFIPDEPTGDAIEELFMPGTLSVLDGTILGATIVPFPAFENASIAIVAGAAMRMLHPRKVDGQTIVSFYMPFAPTPPTPAPSKPPADPMQAVQDALAAVDDAMDALHAAVDGMGGE